MACLITPTVLVNGKEEESKLFNELANFFGRKGNREIIKAVYAIATNKDAMSAFSEVLYNEQGEPTLESLAAIIDLNDLTNLPNTIELLSIKYGFLNSNKEYKLFVSHETAFALAKLFNENNKGYVAIVTRSGNKFVVEVKEANMDAVHLLQEVTFHNELSLKLLGIVRRLGFDVSYDDRMKFHGLFDPTNATETVNGLLSVIRISKGEEGELALPEEVSHLIISGLKQNPLVKRLFESITPEIAKLVLGEQYDTYKELYNNDLNLLKEEAAGKLLAALLLGLRLLVEHPTSIISRIWNFAKSLFRNSSVNEINAAISQTNDAVDKLASFIVSPELDKEFSKESALSSKALYNATAKVDRMKVLAEKAEEVASKVLIINLSRTFKTKYDTEDVKRIKKLREDLGKKKYKTACTSFLQNSLTEIKKLQDDVKKIKAESPIELIRYLSSVLRRVKSFMEGYGEVIKDMTTLVSLLELGLVSLTPELAKELQAAALEITALINSVEAEYNEKRRIILVKFLRQYWGEDKTIKSGKNKGLVITLESILDYAEKDINFLDRYISSMADASDSLLAVIDRAVTDALDDRDAELFEALLTISALNEELIKAGYDSSFMIERDSKGKKTGRIISDIDFEKYENAKAAKIKELTEKYEGDKVKARVEFELWLNDNTESIILNPTADVKYLRTEIRPKKSIYRSNALDRLAPAQRKYYDNIMKIKMHLNAMIPSSAHFGTYDAVLMRQGLLESLDVSDLKQTGKNIWSLLLGAFVRREDDTDFGDTETTTSIHTDMSGKPLLKLPLSFTKKLKDMELLSTDTSASMIAFAAVAINYSHMRLIVDTLELARDFIKDRDIQQYSGDSKIEEAYRSLGKKFRKAYRTKGLGSNIVERLDDYYASVIYGQLKKDEGTFHIPFTDKQVDVAKTADALKQYTSLTGLGLNPFSGLSNIVVGKMLQWIDGMGGEFFTLKDLSKASTLYYAMLPAYMGELESTNRTNKLSLMADTFDAEEDFFEQAGRNPMFKGMPKRALKRSSLLFMQSAGEHYLHVRTMLAVLQHEKVLINGVESTLYDAFETKTDSNGITRLVLKSDVTTKEGTPVDLEYIKGIKRKIGVVNKSMNGAFNAKDKGAIHRMALGRLLMLFRLWMPAHYYRRYQRATYNAELQEWREGYYRTFGRFTLNMMKDVLHLRFNLATLWDNLSDHEKANVKKALTELNLYLAMSLGTMMIGPVKDKDNVWAERMLLYLLYRTKMETGASIPLPTALIDNAMTIILSPAAAINSCNNLFSLLEVWNMWHEILSGRYLGWSVYERDMIKAIPLAGNILKTMDLTEEEYMFLMFNNTAGKVAWSKK